MATASIAQKNKGGIVLNAGAGFSAFGILGSVSFSLKDEFTIKSKSTPAFVGSLDYAFENRVSIGIGGGYQAVHQTISDYQYMDANGVDRLGSFSYDVSRLNAGIRVLYHFGNGPVDIYIGMKPGVNIYQIQLQKVDEIPTPSWAELSGTTFAFQFIPLGLRGYFTDNFGFFMETGFGAPSFISGGLCLGMQLPTEKIHPTN